LVLGMLASLEKMSCWTIAEYRGDLTPDRLQHLPAPVKWDADAVRDDLRGYAAEAFAESDAVLAGMRREALRKGTVSAGVQHQYTGTAGRIENGQIACT
jgi:SRSO17 transposase